MRLWLLVVLVSCGSTPEIDAGQAATGGGTEATGGGCPRGGCAVGGGNFSSSGGGVATGGGSATGGGAAVADVFVTLKYDFESCCFSCDCKRCQLNHCTVTKQMPPTKFAALRTSSLGTCAVSQTASDGYMADCTALCTTRTPGCFSGGKTYPDTVITCTTIADTAFGSCGWTP